MSDVVNHSWKLRLCIGLLMLILGFIGMIVTDISRDGAWLYWRNISAVFAILSLSLSIYLQKMRWKTTVFTIWHELFHWVGLLLTIVTIDYFVTTGIMGRFQAGLVALALLAFATYLIGVYIETTFIPVGIILGVFAAGTALFAAYIYSIILPLTIIAALVVVWMVHRMHKAYHPVDKSG